MAKTLIASQQTNSQAIKPYLVYSKLRQICKHLIPGQQEDAHEFLRYLMEAMEKAYLARYGKPSQFDQYSKETTPLNQILGGYLKSSVRCLACGHVSVTFQHFEDLLLDIRKANTVDEALDLYFSRERLEDMGYKCESCKKKVAATKQFSLERAPISLCIQLKRFSIVGNKLNKHINIRQQLNLSKYSSRKDSTQQLSYRLVSMVTHLGASQHCGHYTAIGHTDAGGYYQFDDSCVRPISLQNVLHTNSYIMFYELESSLPRNQGLSESSRASDVKSWLPAERKEAPVRNSPAVSTVTSSPALKPFIGPLLPTDAAKWSQSGDACPPRTNGVASEGPKIVLNGLASEEKNNRDELKMKPRLLSSPNLLEPKTKAVRHPSPSKLTEFIETPINAAHKSSGDAEEKGSTPEKRVLVKPKSVCTQTKLTRLVPYEDDDSDADSGTETPVLEVKTKAGPFQVTTNKLSPNHSTHLSNNSVNKRAASMPDLSDDFEPAKAAAHNANTPFTATGKRPGETLTNGSTASKLMKLNSRGYGAPVVSWSGQQSNLEKEVL